MMHLFLNPAERHGLQLDGGGFVCNQPGRITDEMLAKHTAGRVTLTTPVVADDGSCRFLVIDDDHGKDLPDTKAEREQTRERGIQIRREVARFVPEHSIATFETGGAGTHTFVLLDRLPVDDVALVAAVLRPTIADRVGVKVHRLETFPSSPSNPAKAEACRYIRVPFGVHRGTGRPSRIAVPSPKGLQWLAYGNLPILDLKPLDEDRFREIVEYARPLAPASSKRTVADLRTRWIGDRPSLGHDLAPVIEHCEVFRGCLLALRSGVATSQEAVFAASIASHIEDGLDRVLDFVGDITGYAQTLLEKAANRQIERDLPPILCTTAQRSCLCPGPCPAAVAGNLRHAAELAAIKDKKWFRNKVRRTSVTLLPEAREAITAAMLAGLRRHMPRPPIALRVGSEPSHSSIEVTAHA